MVRGASGGENYGLDWDIAERLRIAKIAIIAVIARIAKPLILPSCEIKPSQFETKEPTGFKIVAIVAFMAILAIYLSSLS
jgi:hypothetical protein